VARRWGARLGEAPRRALAPAAAGGLVAGHFLTYVFIAPAGPARAVLLQHTGHAYFPRAVAAAAALGALAMGAAAARGVARRHPRSRSLGWRPLAVRMACAQALGFVVLEIVERVIVKAPLGGVAAVLPVGFAVESLVAAAVAAVLCLTVRAAETVARVLGWEPSSSKRAPRSIPVDRRLGDRVHPVLESLSLCVTLRGPPSPSPA